MTIGSFINSYRKHKVKKLINSIDNCTVEIVSHDDYIDLINSDNKTTMLDIKHLFEESYLPGFADLELKLNGKSINRVRLTNECILLS